VKTTSALVGVTLLLLSGCSPTSGLDGVQSAAGFAPNFKAVSPAGKYIRHIVIIIQENRTFDNIFAGFPGADSSLFGYTHDGKKIRLRETNFFGTDMYHGWPAALYDWDNGKMDNFDLNGFVNGRLTGRYPYAYLQRSLVTPYWTMARKYVLADHMCPTEFGPSFTAHLDAIAGNTDLRQNSSLADLPTAFPWGCGAPPGTLTAVVNAQRNESLNQGVFPCLTQFRTIADTLDTAGVSWRYYGPPGDFGISSSPFAAVARVRDGPDWSRNVVSPQTKVYQDAGDATTFAQVSWVTPDEADSDHLGSNSDSGPSWVASVVNAIGEGPNWKSTAVIVLWDEWGGWYDHVPPPQLDFRGLGIRVPMIIISPYGKPHYLSHTVYEYGSILKFIEETFGLPALGSASEGYTDTRANSILDVFDFKQMPRAFTPIPLRYSPSYFLRRPPSDRPADDE
jgi:phospholipase C